MKARAPSVVILGRAERDPRTQKWSREHVALGPRVELRSPEDDRSRETRLNCFARSEEAIAVRCPSFYSF
jgi:hypothetical protein